MFSQWFKKKSEEENQNREKQLLSRGEELSGTPGSKFVGYLPTSNGDHPFIAFNISDFESMCFLFDELLKARGILKNDSQWLANFQKRKTEKFQREAKQPKNTDLQQ